MPRIRRDYGVGLTSFSPLAEGLLTGKYSGGTVPEGSQLATNTAFAVQENIASLAMDVDRLMPIAQQLNCSLAQLAIAWAASNPELSSVIVGARSAEQVRHNMAALELLPKLSPEIKAEMGRIAGTDPRPTPAFRAATQQ
jgi:aryl-alcohol dehydrogenase-like predicted oxidoreductase